MLCATLQPSPSVSKILVSILAAVERITVNGHSSSNRTNYATGTEL